MQLTPPDTETATGPNVFVATRPSPPRALDGPARFVAVRKAGASFHSAFNVRSERYVALLEEHTRLGQTLAQTKADLVDALYAAVPQCNDQAGRRLLLKLKRRVYNSRPVAHLTTEDLDPALGRRLDAYSDLLSLHTDLFERHAPAVFAEYRQHLDQLLEDEAFQAACRYASPDLIKVLEVGRKRPVTAFTNLDRGLYAYATKFISKANPFHLFAALGFSSEMNLEASGECEVVLDAISLFKLEEHLIPQVEDPARRLLYLRNYVREEGKLTFLIYQGREQRFVAVPETPQLHQVLAYFREEEDERTFAGCMAYVQTRFPEADPETIKRFLIRLIKAGIVVQFLIRDVNTFDRDLAEAADVFHAELRDLRQYHHAHIRRDALPTVQEHLATIHIGPLDGSTLRYYVNQYGLTAEEIGRHEDAVRPVFEDLRAVKPFFKHLFNCANNNGNLKAYVRDYLAVRNRTSAPYLEVLFHFLRHKTEILGRYTGNASRSPEEARTLARWSSYVNTLNGRLDDADLADLTLHIPPGPERFLLCFNGPFDYERGLYYLSNIWEGNGRFTHRYLAEQQDRTYLVPPSDEPCLDVQLATAFYNNRNYVADVFDTGCSFEAYHRPRFKHWIFPADILLEYGEEGLRYRHAQTGQRLRFHYLGSVMNGLLESEYQLLLTDSADIFWNVFDHRQPPDGDRSFKPGLYYRSLCLRRDRWAVRKRCLPEALPGENILAYTARFRAWVHTTMKPDVDDWYCRLEHPDRGDEDPVPANHKPFYVDLTNPLNLYRFRRKLSDLPANGVIYFERMEPPIDHLYQADGAPFLTELMIEV